MFYFFIANTNYTFKVLVEKISELLDLITGRTSINLNQVLLVDADQTCRIIRRKSGLLFLPELLQLSHFLRMSGVNRAQDHSTASLLG